MQSRVIGDILNYYTGERLPVVMAKVGSVGFNDAFTQVLVGFETSSQYVNGTFRYDESVRHALVHGAEVPVAIRFVRSGRRQMGASIVTTAIVVMAGLTSDALDNPDGNMVYSVDARTA